jgi:hypothetical protein
MVLISLLAFWGCGRPKADSVYLWSEPTFSGESVMKEFDDFSVQYPSDWIVTCSISKEEAADSK